MEERAEMERQGKSWDQLQEYGWEEVGFRLCLPRMHRWPASRKPGLKGC